MTLRVLLVTGTMLAAGAAAPALACMSGEEHLVSCLLEKDPAAARAIRDADTQEGFVEALKEGAALCHSDVEEMSLGKLFDNLNAALDKADAAASDAETWGGGAS